MLCFKEWEEWTSIGLNDKDYCDWNEVHGLFEHVRIPSAQCVGLLYMYPELRMGLLHTQINVGHLRWSVH